MSRWTLIADKLDRVSRTRALTEQESVMLERALNNGRLIDEDAKPEPKGFSAAQHNKWTEYDDERLLDMQRQGCGPSEIAVRMGRSRGSVGGRLFRLARG